MKKQRFIADNATQYCAEDRKFQNGKCVYNQILGFAYSVDEIVDVLNNNGTFSDVFDELLQLKIWYLQGMYRRTGDEMYKTIEKEFKQLRRELYHPSAIDDYAEKLKEFQKE